MALGEACTIVVRGATQQILDEAERSLHDALCVLQQTVKETRVVFGGGKDHTYSIVLGMRQGMTNIGRDLHILPAYHN